MGNNVNSAGKILLIATGGTIACRETGHGLTPVLDGEGLLRELPELSGVCGVEVLDLMQRDSTDITAEDRMQMARAVWENRGAYDGFVIAHGTDTLACTAALLHHLLPHIDRPVVVTGSMLPMGAEGSDAPGNLLDALRVAADGRRGVYAVLRGSILRGTNVLKVHSTALDAFVSANEPPAGRVADGNSAVVLLGPTRLSERHYRDVRRRRHPGAHRTGRACTDSGRHARFPYDTVRRGRRPSA